jgi:hypothetical protein
MTGHTPTIVERLREHATDWNGEQMPDLEPAKGDPTAGTLREAAALIKDMLEALRQIEATPNYRCCAADMRKIARAALAKATGAA